MLPLQHLLEKKNWDIPHLLNVHVIQVVLDELHTCSEVRLVELVGDVPSKWPKLTSLLYSGM